MLETAIIGGGLCGVALARSLHRQGRAVALFEARRRLGGRILSVAGEVGHGDRSRPDLVLAGHAASVTQLIAELGLASIPQHDEGSVLHLNDSDKKPERIDGKKLHNGARRLEGGMASLIDALAEDCRRSCLHFDHVLTACQRSRRSCRAHICAGDDTSSRSRRGTSCSPFRRDCWTEHVRFEPGLDDATRDAMRATGTWMAAQAKVVISLRSAVLARGRAIRQRLRHPRTGRDRRNIRCVRQHSRPMRRWADFSRCRRSCARPSASACRS